jgi:hypothetical protein
MAMDKLSQAIEASSEQTASLLLGDDLLLVTNLNDEWFVHITLNSAFQRDGYLSSITEQVGNMYQALMTLRELGHEVTPDSNWQPFDAATPPQLQEVYLQ